MKPWILAIALVALGVGMYALLEATQRVASPSGSRPGAVAASTDSEAPALVKMVGVGPVATGRPVTAEPTGRLVTAEPMGRLEADP